MSAKLSNLDRQAEAIILSQKLLKKSVSSAHLVQKLAGRRTSYKKLWSIVRRARRRANRKYKAWQKYEIDVPKELVVRWVTDGLVPLEHFEKILPILVEYKRHISRTASN